MIDKDDILQLGRLLQIEIKDFELEQYLQGFNESLGRLNAISTLKINNEELWTSPARQVLETRPDQNDVSPAQKMMLDGSLTKSNDFFKIP